MQGKRVRTPGGRILTARFSIVFRDGRWYPASGKGQEGNMTIYEARAECKRRNSK